MMMLVITFVALLVTALVACVLLFQKKTIVVNEAPAVAEQRHAPKWWRRDTALLIDVNNVRGALKFEADLPAICGACCYAAEKALSPVALFVDHGPRCCAVRASTSERVDAILCFAGKKSGPFATADDMIVASVGRCAKRDAVVTVVTSDRQLGRRCKFAALRFPNAKLRVVQSYDLADWLLPFLYKDTNEDHPFRSAQSLIADTSKNDWLKDAPRLPKKKLAPFNAQARSPPEGTPSRVFQATGLYKRIEIWLDKQKDHNNNKQHHPDLLLKKDPNEKQLWLQDLLDRHPW